MLVLHCCDQVYLAGEAQAGRTISCARCGKLLVVAPPAVRPIARAGWTSGPLVKPVLTALVGVTIVIVAAYRGLQRGTSAIGEILNLRTGAAVSDPIVQRKQAILTAALSRASDPELAALYDEVNQRHFDGRLPAIPITWDASLEDMDGVIAGESSRFQGLTDGKAMVVRPGLAHEDAELRRTLCHEAVHVKLLAAGLKDTRHGERFQAELRRIFEEGCFEAILASDAERSALRQWIDREAGRLEHVREQLDATQNSLRQQSDELERAIADFNDRMSAANSRRSGWPTGGEQAALRERQARSTERSTDYNAAVAQFNVESLRLNRERDRYRLMMVYPHGIDEELRASKGIR